MPADGVLVQPVRYLREPARTVAKVCSRSPLRSPRVTRRGLRNARVAIATFRPEVAVVSEVMTFSLAKHLLPGVPVIYDAQNVESAVYRDFAASATGVLDRVTFAIDRRRVAAEERRLLDVADAVLTVSEEDAVGLRLLGAPEPIVVVPNSVARPRRRAARTGPPVLLMVGSLDYPPNVAAVEELVGTLFPAVRAEVPDAELIVAGRRPTSRVRRLVEDAPGVRLVADPADLDPLYAAARCALIPIRSGGGSRLKIYEALAHGLPVVSTTFAASGTAPGTAILTRESATDLVNATVAILVDDEYAEQCGRAAADFFDAELTWERAAAPLSGLIGGLLGGG